MNILQIGDKVVYCNPRNLRAVGTVTGFNKSGKSAFVDWNFGEDGIRHGKELLIHLIKVAG